jgi:hypothetical protein
MIAKTHYNGFWRASAHEQYVILKAILQLE